MKDYNNIDTIILHFLQKDITEEEMLTLVNWINESADNKQTFFRLKKMYDESNLKLYPVAEDIEKNKKRLLRTIEKNETAKHQKLRLYTFIRYAAVAVITLVLTIGGISISNKSAVNFIELDVESGPRMSHMTLPDGTKVVLNASTKLKFPDKFDKKIREVYLDGEAFFDVTSNKKIPFIVYTDKQRIEVLGTQFNIMDYAIDDYSITTLISGKIKMQSVTEDGNWGEEVYLKPDQQVFFNSKTHQLALSDIKIDTKRTWVNKVYHFKAEPLQQITKRLEKIYGVKINIANDDLKQVAYTGTFGLDQEIETVLKIINFDRQFTYTYVNDEIIIQ